MSHFNVLVVNTKGENDVEKQLEPYQELNLPIDELKNDPRAEFDDKTDEFKEEYENKTHSEFYCSSNSSWGFKLPKEKREKLFAMDIGDTDILSKERETFSYLEKDHKYGVYDFKYDAEQDREVPVSDKREWFEVIDIIENNNHSNPNLCFTGVVKIKKISPPAKIPFKDTYKTFEEFCKGWHGIEPNEEGRYGYYNNPKAKWDWYEVGGRWAGMLKLKENATADQSLNFSHGWEEADKLAVMSQNVADQARKSEIDWSRMNGDAEAFEEHSRFWEIIIEDDEPKNEDETDMVKWNMFKSEYFTKKFKNKETYIKCQMNFSTYAILIDGEWMGKGEMGWWGMSDEDFDEAVEWESNFYNRFIKDLPEDTLITVVDCHI